MSNKLLTCYLILMSVPLFFGCSGPVKADNNNASPGSLSLHVGNDKYYIIHPKESVIAWEGSGFHGKHDGYAYISKGELMIENGQLTGGAAEIDMNKTEGPGHDKDNNLINNLKGPDFLMLKNSPFLPLSLQRLEQLMVKR